MNILVTGANGQLGREMRLVSAQSTDRYIFTDVAGDDIAVLDITDPAAIDRMVSDHDIKCIINCAAYTNVDKAEDDYDLAELLNGAAPGYLAAAMRRVGGALVHVSTDYVFGGAQGNTPRTEAEAPNPTGVYGLTKLHGEEAVARAFAADGHPEASYIILRTAWLYSEHGKNFVKTMLALTASRPSLSVVFDQVGTPTYAMDLARAIYDIVEGRKYQGRADVYHYSNEGVCSWYDFTKMIAEYAGHGQCDVQPCHSSEFPSKVVRPSYSVLDKTKIKSELGVKVPYWTESLRQCLANMGPQ